MIDYKANIMKIVIFHLGIVLQIIGFAISWK